MMFKRITIIGLGLIGGSLALAVKERGLAKEVVGVSRRKSTLRRVLSTGAVDKATIDIKKGIKRSDFVVLSTPVLKIMDMAALISPFLSKGALVTDAGSTKTDIVKKAESVLTDNVHFVGSHPLAGSEKSGILHADKDLFKGAYCILTKTGSTDSRALARTKRFWRELGMKVEIMTPERHDKVVSRLSHLPHAVSACLSNACGKKELRLAAGGFRDTARIASGSPELWRDIFITNRKNIIRDIRLYKKELSRIEKALQRSNSPELLKLFKEAKTVRDSIA